MKGYLVAALVAAVLIEWFWLTQLYHLMGRRDDEFPGSRDKLAWAIILVTLNAVGAALYRFRISSRQASATTALSPSEENAVTTCPECSKKMPVDATQCPSCGWSYFDK